MSGSGMDGGAGDQSWSLPIAWVAFVMLVLTVMVIAGVTFVVQELVGRAGPPAWFLAIWFAFLGWNVYWWLFRVAFRVDLVGTTVSWRAPLAGGSVPASAIESVGRVFAAPYTCVLRAPGHRSVIVTTQLRSFEPMLTALNRLNPAVPPRQ